MIKIAHPLEGAMSTKKRNKTRRRKNRAARRLLRQENNKTPSILWICPASLDKPLALRIGLKIKNEALPQYGLYRYASTTFEAETELKQYLDLKPNLVIVIWMHQVLTGLAKFYEALARVKHQHPGYNPKIISWEIVSGDREIPAMFPQRRPDLKHEDGVVADMSINRSQRNYLN